MLSKIKEDIEDNDIDELVNRVKKQTIETDTEKIKLLLEENNLDYISVIKILLGIKEKKISTSTNNVNREKYIQIRKFVDNIYNNK